MWAFSVAAQTLEAANSDGSLKPVAQAFMPAIYSSYHKKLSFREAPKEAQPH